MRFGFLSLFLLFFTVLDDGDGDDDVWAIWTSVIIGYSFFFSLLLGNPYGKIHQQQQISNTPASNPDSTMITLTNTFWDEELDTAFVFEWDWVWCGGEFVLCWEWCDREFERDGEWWIEDFEWEVEWWMGEVEWWIGDLEWEGEWLEWEGVWWDVLEWEGEREGKREWWDVLVREKDLWGDLEWKVDCDEE